VSPRNGSHCMLCDLADKVQSFLDYPMTHSNPSRDPLTDAIASNPAGWYAGIERRRSHRATLHWTLYLKPDGSSHPVRTEASNISRDGFYCVLDQPVRPGDRVRCDIVVPTHSSQNPDDVVYLRCSAHVVRVEQIGAGPEYGLACRIENYYVIHGAYKNSACRM